MLPVTRILRGTSHSQLGFLPLQAAMTAIRIVQRATDNIAARLTSRSHVERRAVCASPLHQRQHQHDEDTAQHPAQHPVRLAGTMMRIAQRATDNIAARLTSRHHVRRRAVCADPLHQRHQHDEGQLAPQLAGTLTRIAQRVTDRTAALSTSKQHVRRHVACADEPKVQ